MRFRLGLAPLRGQGVPARGARLHAGAGGQRRAPTCAPRRATTWRCASGCSGARTRRAPSWSSTAASIPGDARAADVAFQLGDLHEAGGPARRGRCRSSSARWPSSPSPALRDRAAVPARALPRAARATPTARCAAYEQAAAATDRTIRSACRRVARCAALHETRRELRAALAAYRDIIEERQGPGAGRGGDRTASRSSKPARER